MASEEPKPEGPEEEPKPSEEPKPGEYEEESKPVALFKRFINERATRHIGLAFLLVGLIALAALASIAWSTGKARELSANLRHGEVLGSGQQEQVEVPLPVTKLRFSNQVKATDEEKARLEGQVAEVRSRARFHLQSAVFVFANYYMSIILLSLTGAVAAVMLVLISKAGWEKANEYIITVFFVMTAATVFFGAFPGLFRQEESINDNKLLYLKYVALEDQILTYAATGAHPSSATREPTAAGGEQSPPTEPEGNGGRAGNELEPGTATGGAGPGDTGRYLEPRDFILYVDRELAADNKIPIGLDYSKVPTYTDVFKIPQSE
jgi:hypothetical protein